MLTFVVLVIYFMIGFWYSCASATEALTTCLEF